MLCPTCGSRNTVKNGTKPGDLQEHVCRPCKATNGKGGYFYTPLGLSGRIPKILIMDIETAPMRIFTWGLYKGQHPGIHQVISDWNVISWAAKWLFGDKMMSDVITPKEITTKIYYDPDGPYRADDKRILQSIWDLVDEADEIVAHNGQKFDLRKLRARWLELGFKRPMPFTFFDTLKVAQREFATSSHKQAWLTQILGTPKKLDTDFGLWRHCMDGDKKALSKMLKYNKRDVRGLEPMYLKIRPWANSQPNMAILMDIIGEACPSCGSQDLDWPEDKAYYTTVSRFPVFRCNDCHGIGRSRFNDLTKEQRKLISSPIAR